MEYLVAFSILGSITGLLLALAIDYILLKDKRTKQAETPDLGYIQIKKHRKVGAGSYTIAKEEIIEELMTSKFDPLFESRVTECGKYVEVSIKVVKKNDREMKLKYL